jgi:hypothetical protein
VGVGVVVGHVSEILGNLDDDDNKFIYKFYIFITPIE